MCLDLLRSKTCASAKTYESRLVYALNDDCVWLFVFAVDISEWLVGRGGVYRLRINFFVVSSFM